MTHDNRALPAPAKPLVLLPPASPALLTRQLGAGR